MFKVGDRVFYRKKHPAILTEQDGDVWYFEAISGGWLSGASYETNLTLMDDSKDFEYDV